MTEKISIHALREEGDKSDFVRALSTDDFNPRPPRGGRRFHALLSQLPYNFNPRPPRGGRRTSINFSTISRLFQSTPSARRATETSRRRFYESSISIHALREEGDLQRQFYLSGLRHFNPRPPRGGRRARPFAGLIFDVFQSTPSARRATEGDTALCRLLILFQSTPSARRATGQRR